MTGGNVVEYKSEVLTENLSICMLMAGCRELGYQLNLNFKLLLYTVYSTVKLFLLQSSPPPKEGP